MIGRNIKKYRLLNGLSLREMGKELNVSHQTIKKYENEEMTPNSTRLIEIAKLFKISITDLVNAYDIPILKFENFRKKNSLPKKKYEGLKMLISDEIGKYIEILNLANDNYSFDKSRWTYNIDNVEELDDIASKVRKELGLSNDCPLDSLIDRLEINNFLILEINFEENFDGFCEHVDDLAFIILSSKGYERNRFTLAHELGHLILNFKNNINEKEKEIYCDKFASILLMPKKDVERKMKFNGLNKKRNVSFNEILLLAKEYKVSPNSVIMRLYSLGVIDEFKKKELFTLLTKNGYKNKQLKIVSESPTREKGIIFKLEAEKIISTDEAIKYLGVTTDEYFRTNFNC